MSLRSSGFSKWLKQIQRRWERWNQIDPEWEHYMPDVKKYRRVTIE